MRLKLHLHKAIKSLLPIAAVCVLLPSSAHADLVKFLYSTASGEAVEAAPDDTYINPVGKIDAYLSAGLDRKVELAIEDSSGSVYDSARSSLIKSTDRVIIDGKEYYAKKLEVDAPEEGTYELVSKIISSEGSVVDEQRNTIVVDLTPPEFGQFTQTNDVGSAYEWNTQGSIWVGGKYNNQTNLMGIEGISDENGINKETGRISFEGKTDVSPIEIGFDDKTGVAGPIITDGWFPEKNTTVSSSWFVEDKAGNISVANKKVQYQGTCGALPEPYAVHNPYSSSSVLGRKGFERYSSGMSIHENPLQVIFRLRKDNWTGNGGMGLNMPGTLIHTGNEYVYLLLKGVVGTSDSFGKVRYDFNYSCGWLESFLNVTYGNGANPPPEFSSVQFYFSDEGWGSSSRNVSSDELPVTVSDIRFHVIPRNYTQLVTGAFGTCRVQPGRSYCDVPWSYTMKKGTAGYIHGCCSTQGASGSEVSQLPASIGGATNVYNDANRNLKGYRYYPAIVWNDRFIPEVTDHEVSGNIVKAQVHMPNEGGFQRRLHYGEINGNMEGIKVEPRLVETFNSGMDKLFEFDVSSAETGVYDLTINSSNSHGSQSTYVVRDIQVDTLSPEIKFSVANGDNVKSLDDILVKVSDDIDQNVSVTRVSISGGPEADSVQLSLRGDQESGYHLEYPVLFPSLESGEEYVVTVSAKDAHNNIASNSVTIVYDPERVEMSYGDGFEAYLPAISKPFYRPNGARIIESKTLYLGDGTPVVGEYELIATMRSDAEVPLVIDGRRLDPGDSVVLDPNYRFSDNDSKISVTAYPAEDGMIGTSSLLLSTTAPNAPVLLTNITTWLPVIALTADSWEVKQLVDLVDIRAERNGETTCRVSMDEEEAKTADPIADPVCLMEWTQKPIETNVVAAGEGEAHISKLFGNAIHLGEQAVAYELFLFSATGEKMKVGEGSHPLTVVNASDSVQADVVPGLEETYRYIRPVSGMVRESTRSRCRFFSDASTAKGYGKSIPYDSPQLACHLEITGLPEGVEARPGSRPAFSGSVSSLGEAAIDWDITAFSRTGVEVLVGRDTHTFNVIDPPKPEIDFISDNAQRRAFENEDREPGIPEGELVTVPYDANYLGKAFYRSGPGGLSVAVSETGAESPMVEDRFGVPLSDRQRLLMSRVKAEERYPLFSTLPLTIEAGYTDHPTMTAVHQVEPLVVPGEHVQPYLYVEADDRTVLNTETTRLRVEIGDPRFDGPYTAERMGEWEVRIVNELRRDEFVVLSDFKDAGHGTASFELELDPDERNNVRLLAEARLKSPVDDYQRTEFSASPVYVTVLEGNPLNAEIETRTLSGPAPYRGIFQLDFETVDELRASGAIEWRVREEGDAWDIDQRSADDRKRLRKTTHFETPGTYEVEARVTNRHSGATSVTQKARIIVYDVPTLTLEAPRTAFIGDNVTLKAKVEDDDGSDVPLDELTVEWSTDLGSTWNEGPKDFPLTRDEKDSVIVWVRVKPEAAPANDRYAWEQDNAGVSFREEKDPSFYVQGPRQVEAGKPYEFGVTERPPYIGFNRELEGYFTLPDGTQLQGDQLEDGRTFMYTPTEEDLADGILPIRYTGWVEGYREQTTTDDVLEARVWEYTWPVWGMYVADNASVAPAEVLLRVRKMTRSNRLEGLKYEWELDPDLQVESAYSQLMRKVVVPEPGTYSYKLTISDARGHETVLEDELTYGKPEPFTIEQRRYYSNRYMRNPLQVSVSPRVDGGHPRDFVRQFEFEVNGEPVEDASRNARLTLDEGEHEILVRMTSDHGKVVESTETVEVVENKPPTCDLRLSDYRTSWRYRADCRDEDGRVHDYEWTINGELSGLSGYGLAVSKGQYETKPHVELRGKDDSGDYSEPVSK